jgi:predicted glycoside hydrolase/deacetylase ChbG (UPF0249 family)
MPDLVIVNADDYALTTGTSRAILRAHHEGIVTSTSVLVLGPAFRETAPWLTREPALGVGVHLAAVGEDPPLAPPEKIPSLCRGGKLPASWRTFLGRALAGKIDPLQVEHEFALQIQAVLDVGLKPTHLDTHQHLHIWPAIGQVVLRLCDRFRIPAIRVPRAGRGRPPSILVDLLGRRLGSRARAAGVRYPRQFGGFDQAGAMTKPKLLRLLQRAVHAGSFEIGVHPGLADDPERARYQHWGYSWSTELETLMDPAIRKAAQGLGLKLGTYADLATA